MTVLMLAARGVNVGILEAVVKRVKKAKVSAGTVPFRPLAAIFAVLPSWL